MGTNCPHCGQLLKFRHEQSTMRHVLIMGDCLNPECKAFESTMTVSTREFTPEEAADMAEYRKSLGLKD